MSHAASEKNPGLGVPYPYQSVWDADKVYACICDKGYTGPSCNLRDCPHGDDPLTGFLADPVYGEQVNERQQIICTASGGKFALSFQKQTTAPISFSASAADIKAKLEALDTVRTVAVSFSAGQTSACSPSGNVLISIEFLEAFGPLPLLVADTRKLSPSPSLSPLIVISQLAQGTKQSLPCSGRGKCQPQLGFCQCYPGFASSNGANSPGKRGDCGYLLPGTVASCPTIDVARNCSGHGLCKGDPNYKCECYNGWSGGDCSEK